MRQVAISRSRIGRSLEISPIKVLLKKENPNLQAAIFPVKAGYFKFLPVETDTG